MPKDPNNSKYHPSKHSVRITNKNFRWIPENPSKLLSRWKRCKITHIRANFACVCVGMSVCVSVFGCVGVFVGWRVCVLVGVSVSGSAMTCLCGASVCLRVWTRVSVLAGLWWRVCLLVGLVGLRWRICVWVGVMSGMRTVLACLWVRVCVLACQCVGASAESKDKREAMWAAQLDRYYRAHTQHTHTFLGTMTVKIERH